MKSENPTSPAFQKGLKAYFLAARPRTWILSLSPVCIGTCMAPGPIDFSVFGLALFFGLFIQIGTNYANDYFDFINGADTSERIGPPRATAAGWIAPSDMLRATVMVFVVAFLSAIPLMMQVGLWSIPIAGLCIMFGILYTGGPKPLGYLGLGEILVLVFFGPVACCGAYFLQTTSLSFAVFIASLAPGFISMSALVANNLRDQMGDAKAGKKTLIVRFGRSFGSREYAACIVIAGLVPAVLVLFCNASWVSLVPMLVLPAAIPAMRKAFYFHHPRELIAVLQASAFLLFLYTFLFCVTWR